MRALRICMVCTGPTSRQRQAGGAAAGAARLGRGHPAPVGGQAGTFRFYGCQGARQRGITKYKGRTEDMYRGRAA